MKAATIMNPGKCLPCRTGGPIPADLGPVSVVGGPTREQRVALALAEQARRHALAMDMARALEEVCRKRVAAARALEKDSQLMARTMRTSGSRLPPRPILAAKILAALKQEEQKLRRRLLAELAAGSHGQP